MEEKIVNLDQSRAPIYEALEQFRQMRVVPFDVPGHKRGRGNPELTEFLGKQCVGVDVNSMKPLDNLCHPVSVIREAEMLAADAFGAANAFLMVGGTTSAVQSMVLTACKRGDEIILPRNVHRSVINALVLNGAIPVYVNPEVDKRLGIALGMKREQVANAIKEHPNAVAVLVNNPTYYGICSDLKAIVEMAHEAGMLCLADEAHGTHFYFGDDLPISAMAAGADMAAVSMPPLMGACDEPVEGYEYRLGGPTCLSGDVVGTYYFKDEVNVGDRLIFGDMAIYTTCKNNTFNGMPLPTIYSLKENGYIEKIVSFGYEDFKGRLGNVNLLGIRS